MWITIRALIFKSAKAMAAIALAGVIFWQVATNCGPQEGIAYVHVLAFDVHVIVDDLTYYLETPWQSPLVCVLRPGRHSLQMSRHGQVLYQEEFTVARGEPTFVLPYERPAQATIDTAATTLTATETHETTPSPRRNRQALECIRRGCTSPR
jgi:hypothetical protein